jgi:methanogenic corrinoid protein MtbC1
MSTEDAAFESIAKAILSGNETAALEAATKAIDEGIGIDAIVMESVLKAWSDFCAWYEKDEKESLKAWLDIFNATLGLLKHLEAKTVQPKDRPFSVLVVTVLGEGHVLMREILATLLRARGLKVYTSRKGVRIGDLSEALADPRLRFVVLSCIQSDLQESVQALVKGVKERRKDVTVIAGGPMAAHSGADVVVNDLPGLNSIMRVKK